MVKKCSLFAVGAALLSLCGWALAQPPAPRPGSGAIPPMPDTAPAGQATAPTGTGPNSGPTPPLPPASQFSPPAPPSPPQGPTVTPAPYTPPAYVETQPEAMSIDQLMDAVDALRAQKADLEKKEAVMLKVLMQKAEKQKVRIDGLVPGPKVPPLPPGK